MTYDSVGQFHFNFHGNIMSFVEEVAMSKQESDLFRESCFGHFLEMPSITRSSKILSNLMMRTGYFDGLPKAEDRLHIEIGGVPREFTREDFSLITGLRVDDSYKATEYDEVAPGGLYVETFKQGALATWATLQHSSRTTRIGMTLRSESGFFFSTSSTMCFSRSSGLLP